MAASLQPKPFASDLFGLPLLCGGLGLIAVCILIPQAEANKKVAVEREQLRRDVAHADAQVAVNARFLFGATADPEVAERLAQRQLRQLRDGTAAVDLGGDDRLTITTVDDMLRVPTPPPAPAYRPPAGVVGALTNTHRRQLFGLAGGLFLVGSSLLLGTGDDRTGVAASAATDGG